MREIDIFTEANQMFESYFALIKDEQWDEVVPTAPDWSVERLVAHVISNNLATAAILAGEKPSDEAEVLGDTPEVAWSEAAQAAEGAAAGIRDGEAMVNSPLGEMSKASFLRLMTIDRTVHAWDLAKAIGADMTLIPEIGQAAYEWVPVFAKQLHEAGEFGDAFSVAGDATAQERLLAITGREPS
jgi:uncharacterized protein (TIGR03086 family)